VPRYACYAIYTCGETAEIACEPGSRATSLVATTPSALLVLLRARAGPELTRRP
jgi:hypothetical protein